LKKEQSKLLAGRYLLEERIGKGANAVVIRAMDTLLKIPVAIKVLRDLSAQHQRLNEELKINLRSEAIAALRLSHPQIVRIHNYERAEGREFLVMEYVEGENAKQRQERFPRRSLPVKEVLQIGLRCLEALIYAHSLKIIHYDIKPSNILISDSFEIKLCDFGLAQLSTTPWIDGVTAGTLGFMSPERMQGKRGGACSDLFSLAATLYALAMGRSPYGKKPEVIYQALSAGHPPAQGELPSSVYEFLLHSLALRPEDRFQSSQEMYDTLSRAAREGSSLSWAPWIQAPSSISSSNDISQEETLSPEESLNLGQEELLSSSGWSWLEKSQSSGRLSPRLRSASGSLFSQAPALSAQRSPKKRASSEGMQLIPQMEFQSIYSQQNVQIEAFWMDIQLVSNREYSDFLKATESLSPMDWKGQEPPSGLEDHPVVEISQEEARAYARWVGKRLPSSLEWEAACRGASGRRFPWGDEWEPERCHCRESGARSSSPIGSYPQGASQEGCLDLLGNVWEWSERVTEDRPQDEEQVWVFGGSYRHPCKDRRGVARNAVSSNNAYCYLGFRCAMNYSH